VSAFEHAQPRPVVLERPRLQLFLLVETIVLALGIAFLLLARPGVSRLPFSYVVTSGHSMEPTFWTGDVVLLRRASAYHRGDIVAYRVPAGGPGAGLLVIHRIVGGNPRDGYLVRGDNKPFADPWRPRPQDVVGRVALHVPEVGLVVRYARSPIGLSALAGLVAAAIAFGGGAETRDRRSGRTGRTSRRTS
jgi:signal peptidase